jgi:mannose-1-phosphate guanylyltransferase
MHIVVLAGGKGSRLWPITGPETPKPLLKHQGTGHSLLADALIRALTLQPASLAFITHQSIFQDIKTECEKVLPDNKIKIQYILEPSSRNTAAALAVSTLLLQEQHGDNAIATVFPTDHVINNLNAFIESMHKAHNMAQQSDSIILIGARPWYPESGYGYIEHSNGVVVKFIEKPNVAKSLEYTLSERHLWNCGIMCFKTRIMIEQMQRYCPEILEVARLAIQHGLYDSASRSIQLNDCQYQLASNQSIDIAVLERSSILQVVPSNMEWRDVGNWKNFSESYDLYQNSDGNVIMANAVLHDTSNCYIKSNKKMVATLGVNNLVIVETPDALLVANKNEAHLLSQLYESLKAQDDKNLSE